MGFFDDFMGKSQQRDLDAAYSDSLATTNAGYDQAGVDINDGRNRALADYGQARGAIRDGAAGAQSTVADYTNRAVDTLGEFAEGDPRAGQLYNQALGLDGQEAQQGFYDQYQADPFREFNEDRTTNALLRRYNAAGMGDSGASRLAAARANLERGSQDYNTHLDRLRGESDQNRALGFNAASQQAGYQANAGQQIGQYQYGAGQGIANNYGQQAAMNQNTGNNLGSLAVDRATTNAGNRINYGNATAANRSTGINNLLGVGSLAVRAATAGSGG